MDREFYNNKISTMLQDHNYETADIYCSILDRRVKSFITPFKKCLTDKEFKAVIKQESYLAKFYGLPKIHKSQQIKDSTSEQASVVITCYAPTDLKFRPIVACQNCPINDLDKLLDKLLRPYVGKVKFRIKDTWEFLRRLPSTAIEGDITVTADIASLYTNISTAAGEDAISYYYDQNPGLLPTRFTKQFLIECYRFLQENLYFCFEGTIYRQIDGTGMGRKYAPSLVDIKQGFDEIKLEEKIRVNLPDAVANHFLQSYLRYLDDIYFR